MSQSQRKMLEIPYGRILVNQSKYDFVLLAEGR
jgi:hypothetical protein